MLTLNSDLRRSFSSPNVDTAIARARDNVNAEATSFIPSSHQMLKLAIRQSPYSFDITITHEELPSIAEHVLFIHHCQHRDHSQDHTHNNIESGEYSTEIEDRRYCDTKEDDCEDGSRNSLNDGNILHHPSEPIFEPPPHAAFPTYSAHSLTIHELYAAITDIRANNGKTAPAVQ